LTRKVANVHPDVGIASCESQAKEDRTRDHTDTKWWHRKAKGKGNKFCTFLGKEK